jgi:tetratricopeptide (TPR) repeat protein
MNDGESSKLARDAAADLDAGQYAAAESTAKRSMTVGDAGWGIAIEVLASSLVAQDKTQEALKVYDKLWKSGVWNPRVMLPYALLLVKDGQWERALDAYNRALPNVGYAGIRDCNRLLAEDATYTAADPEPKHLETDIHIALAFTYIDEGTWAGHSQQDRAMGENRKALELEPDSPLASLAFANGLRLTGHKAEARAAFQAVANKYSGDVKTVAEERLGIYHPALSQQPSRPLNNH